MTEWPILAALAACLFLAVLALLAAFRRGGPAPELMALNGRLEALAAGQDRAAERLRAQETLLADRLAEAARRMDAAVAAQNERLHRSLSENARRQQDTAGQIQERLAVIDAARANMEKLGAQVTNLAGILGNKQARGAFGEVQLRQMMEERLPPGGFSWQHALSNNTRCDCLIRMPHPPGPIVVDSKFPLESWLAARDATEEGARLAAQRQFAGDVRRHVEAIASKYILPGETAEGALMFVPSEGVYAELHAAHPALVAEAARRGVYIVSPTTLWAVLNTISALMRDVRMRDEAHRIQDEVHHLLEDVGRLDDRVEALRKHFVSAGRDIEMIETTTRKIARRGEAIAAMNLPDLAALPPADPAELRA